MKSIITLLVLLGTWTAYGQAPRRCLREIARDFFVEIGVEYISPDDEFYTLDPRIIIHLFLMYDRLNGDEIRTTEPLPVQAELSIYTLSTFSAHAPTYTMLVKNGVYKIIDDPYGVDEMLRQLIDYDRQVSLTKEEFKQALDVLLDLMEYNWGRIGGVKITGPYSLD